MSDFPPLDATAPDNRPVMAFCSTCGQLADYMVTEDRRVPRPICRRCLARLQSSQANAERERKERIEHKARKIVRTAKREARRRGRR